ncbi:MAG: hypothetical protein AB2L14_18900 [Candidatus Xenobiia bacterium LiM19]
MGIFEMFFSNPESGKDPQNVTVFSEQELKKRLLEEGQISAIKLVREFSEIGLKEAKEFGNRSGGYPLDINKSNERNSRQ